MALNKKWTKAIIEQLKRGATPDELAMSVALGCAIGLIPFLGFTTLLCIWIAQYLRLNHFTIQLTHHILTPVQLLMIAPFYKAGEFLFGNYHHLWMTVIEGIVVWLIVAPMVYGAVYYFAKKAFARLKFDEHERLF